MHKQGFTLIEMLVVIGIIAVLSGLAIGGFSRATKSAQRAKAQELVANVATALAIVQQNNNGWPKTLASEAAGGDGKLDQNVSRALVYFGNPLDLSYDHDTWNSSTKQGTITLKGTDAFGVVDPWAVAILKNKRSAVADTKVPSGGNVQDHIIHFALDLEGEGFVTANVGGQSRRIRAAAVAWCYGADGKPEDAATYRRKDDVYSWQIKQEEK